jgi:hypothetical protein
LWFTRQTEADAEARATEAQAPESTNAALTDPIEPVAAQTQGGAAAGVEEAESEPSIPTTAQLTLTGVPQGARVSIDGAQRRGTDFELPAGTHTIRIEADGYEPFAYEDRFEAGERFRVPYTASPVAATPTVRSTQQRPAPSPPAPGFLRIGVRPWANVTINGRRIDQVTIRLDTVPPGEYTLRFEHPDFNTVDTTVIVRSGETTVVPIRLSGAG